MQAFDQVTVALPFHENGGTNLPTAGFEEAVARLLFVAEKNWPAAWCWGQTGCGKTTVLQAVAAEIRRANRRVVMLDPRALTRPGFLGIAGPRTGRSGSQRLSA